MRILDIAPFPVFPPDSGGKLRVYSLGNEISKNGIYLDILSLVGFQEKKETIKINPAFYIKTFKTYYSAMINFSSKFNLFPPIASYPLHKIFNPVFKSYFENYDLYQFEFPWLTCWYNLVPQGKPIIYVAHNIESIWHKPIIKRCIFPDHFMKILEDAERNAAEKSDKIIAVSVEDKEQLIEVFGLPQNKIEIIPNGYDPKKYVSVDGDEKCKIRKSYGFNENELLVLFSGSNTYPNDEAFNIIINTILPKIEDTNIKFLIVGGVGEKYRKFQNKRVIITGKVKDVLPYFNCADIAINPIISGSGSNVKILEYLACGLPVISTDFGMRGFADLKKYVTICDVVEFTGKIQKESYFYNENTSPALKRYQWNYLSREMIGIYKELYEK